MTLRTAHPRARGALVALVVAALVLPITACAGDDPTAERTATASDAVAGASVPVVSGPTGSSDGTTGDGNTSQGTASGPTEAGYPTAMVDEEVIDPAFEPLMADIARRVEAAGLPGASLLVLQDGEVVQQEAVGSYDLTTEVPIASASKWLAGATIMSLVDDGLLELDEPISTSLPGVDGPQGAITLRQLVAFTSGLPYDERIPCYGDLSMTLAACNEIILDLPLLGRPGTGYRYTGTHLHVAAGVAEAVTGQTWEEVFQDRIARPLGMDHTTFVHERPGRTASDGHPAPAGSAVSTLGDYGRFLEMLVHDGVAPDGTRVLSSEAVSEMSVDQTGDARFVSAAAHRKAAETPYGVAHWLDRVDDEGRAVVESSPGAFGFRPWIDHANDIAGVYLVVDRDDTHVEDAVQAPGAAADVQTSGEFVVVGSAEALGGQVPSQR
jgi:CubicO group peptidase (beta-lactamase class C family)